MDLGTTLGTILKKNWNLRESQGEHPREIMIEHLSTLLGLAWGYSIEGQTIEQRMEILKGMVDELGNIDRGKFIKEDGSATFSTDPERLVWYGNCTFWTDNWNKLGKTESGIPCCPVCGSPGFQITAGNWEAGVKKFNKKEKGYKEFIDSVKNRCLHVSVSKAWAQYKLGGERN